MAEEPPQEDLEKDRLPEVGETVVTSHRSFTLAEIIGVGGYGCVFRVACSVSTRLLALKAELYSKSVIKNEIVVLKSAATHQCKHMCQLFDYGRVGKQFMYIVMTLLGEDLYKLRRDRVSQYFSLGTTVRAAIQTMKAIEELHLCGFVSRDVKPNNFAVGYTEESAQTIFMFDFGLSKRYIKNSILIPARGTVGWRGTARYGSLNAHRKQDLSRRDDVESWLYMIVEFANGALPWRYVQDRGEVGTMKSEARTGLRNRFFLMCPPQFDYFLTQIDSLEFESEPPYQKFYSTLNEILQDQALASSGPFDWEISDDGDSPSSISQAGQDDDTTEATTQSCTATVPTLGRLTARLATPGQR